MLGDVSGKARTLRVGPRAYCALVRLFSSMTAQVHLQVPGPSELQWAEMALVRPFSGVRGQMLSQLAPGEEAHAAHVALRLSMIGVVHKVVHFQRPWVSEQGPALVAYAWPFSGVAPDMQIVLSLRPKLPRTLETPVQRVVRCLGDVDKC